MPVVCSVAGISIHALFAEGDQINRRIMVRRAVFLSTPSSQRATSSVQHSPVLYGISIHALFAEGDLRDFYEHSGVNIISIHALFAEGDVSSVHW